MSGYWYIALSPVLGVVWGGHRIATDLAAVPLLAGAVPVAVLAMAAAVETLGAL